MGSRPRQAQPTAPGHGHRLDALVRASIRKASRRFRPQQPRIANQVVYTAGDTLTYGELADLLERVTGRCFERREWGVSHLQAQLA